MLKDQERKKEKFMCHVLSKFYFSIKFKWTLKFAVKLGYINILYPFAKKFNNDLRDKRFRYDKINSTMNATIAPFCNKSCRNSYRECLSSAELMWSSVTVYFGC